tara:strand:+ start:767 stop:934 length:168 start_codon:yes stop_codon:yes gene_type:complete
LEEVVELQGHQGVVVVLVVVGLQLAVVLPWVQGLVVGSSLEELELVQELPSVVVV